MHATATTRLLVAKGLRAFGDGFVSLLLPLYLLELGYGAFEVGAIASITLLGSGALTLAVGLTALAIDAGCVVPGGDVETFT